MGVKFRTLLPLSLPPKKVRKKHPHRDQWSSCLKGTEGTLACTHSTILLSVKNKHAACHGFPFFSFFFLLQTRNEIPYSDSETYQLYAVFNTFSPSFLHHPHTTRSWPMSSLGGTWLNAWLSIRLWFFELYFYFGASLGNARWTTEIRFLKRQGGKRFGAWNTTYLLLLSLHFSLSLYPR